ncbi:MAG: hypothetical protein Tsb0014_22150 [Pleurocapsa sp.]
MNKSKFLITLLIIFLCILIPGLVIINDLLTPDYSQKDCEIIRKNYEKLKIGMNK